RARPPRNPPMARAPPRIPSNASIVHLRIGRRAAPGPRSGAGPGKGRDHLVRHQADQLLHVVIRSGSPAICGVAVLARRGPRLALARRPFLGVAAAEGVVAAQVAVLAAVEALVVVAEPLLQVEQLPGLALREVVDVAELVGEDQDLAVGVDD